MRKNQSHQTVELSALLVDMEGQAPAEIKLVPCGSFRSCRDNRPVGVPAWVMNDACATAILSAQAQLQSKFLVDYDHQTLHAATSGTKALAAGWGGSLEWREGDGLYAVDMDWNEAALSAIAAKEYRYISPVIKFDSKTGMVTGVPMAALTNYPALDNLNDLAAAAALLFSTSQEPTMDADELIERLIYMLNLPVTSTPAEIGAELDKVKAMITAADGTTAGLSALLSAKDEELVALSAQIGAEPDPNLYAPVAVVNELRTQLVALSGDTLAMQVHKLVDEADLAGKFIGPSEKEWAIKKGMKDIAALKADLDNTVGMAALTGMQSGGKAPAETETETAALSGFKVPDGGYSVDPGTAAKHNKILAYAQANKVDYTTAAKAVGA